MFFPSRGTANCSLFLLCLTCLTLLMSSVGTIFFQPTLLRTASLVWGLVVCTVCLYGYGRALGATQLYSRFPVITVCTASLQIAPQTKWLLLGADNNNLVLLGRQAETERHAEPHYVIRSEIKTFDIVGSASIDEFLCNQASKSSSR